MNFIDKSVNQIAMQRKKRFAIKFIRAFSLVKQDKIKLEQIREVGIYKVYETVKEKGMKFNLL